MDTPFSHKNVCRLVGELKDYYRLRIGAYRIILSLLEDEKIIAVVNIFPRGDAYKRKRRS